MSEGIIIVGAGQAAAQAVTTLRAQGYDGPLTIIGDEPHLPYQRPPLSKAYLSGALVVERLNLKPRAFYDEHGITLRLGVRAETLDRKARRLSLSDGSVLAYDKILLATGSRVRRVKLPGSDLANIFYLRKIADTDAMRAALKPGSRLALVGGGYIGLEVAAVAAKHGVKVTVLEMMQRLMARVVSAPVSAFYQAEHERAGVTIKLEAMVTGFEGNGRVERVRLADGSAVPCDWAVVGVGVEPNQELAAEAGISCKNGIVVDEYGRTDDPSVYAAGDCTMHPNPFVGGQIRLESVQNAIDQAKHAALAMLGELTPYHEVPWFWSDQYDLKLQIAGISAGYDEMVTRGDPAKRSFAVFYLKSGQLIGVDAVNAVPEYMFGRKLIAARAHVPAPRLADTRVPMKEIASSFS